MQISECDSHKVPTTSWSAVSQHGSPGWPIMIMIVLFYFPSSCMPAHSVS